MPKKLFMVLLTIFSLGLLKTPVAKAEEAQLPSGTPYSQIGRKIEDFVKEHQETTVGMETAVFDREGTIYRGNFGYLDKEKGVKADDDSVFEWASITKLMVWVSVMQLWEEGKLDLEADIQTYLPEGFLKTLRYDKPITMLDLMNHQAGFEESIQAYQEHKGQSLEEILSQNQPAQIFEPGTMTAYSNYSTGLASYIVQRITGQDFADYVHKHIFQPLDMKQTSILLGFRDNDYVRDKRKEAKGYTAEGQSRGRDEFKLGLYSAGMAAGTLGDLQKFAQALLKKDKLFKRPETWETLYTATSNFPGTDLPLNAHGFWAQEYGGNTLIGHSGNAHGFSAHLLLDLENGVGFVVLTNQQYEQVYNYTMPELIFGPRKKTDTTRFADFKPGFYRAARYYETGPMSVLRGTFLYTNYYDSSALANIPDLPFLTYSQENGQDKVTFAFGDYYKVSDLEVYKDYAMYILAGLAVLYALINLLVSLIADLVRLVKKAPAKAPRAFKVWNYLTSMLILAFAGHFALLFSQLLASGANPFEAWQAQVFAVFGLLMLGCLVFPFLAKAKSRLSRGRLILAGLTSLSALAIVINILYWNLYQWWVL